jgi:hypothetical protein
MRIRKAKVGYRSLAGLNQTARARVRNKGRILFPTNEINQRVLIIPLSEVYRITSDAVILKQKKGR